MSKWRREKKSSIPIVAVLILSMLLSKFEEDVVFEYHITIQDEDFNLGILTMRTPEGVFEADFDA